MEMAQQPHDEPSSVADNGARTAFEDLHPEAAMAARPAAVAMHPQLLMAACGDSQERRNVLLDEEDGASEPQVTVDVQPRADEAAHPAGSPALLEGATLEGDSALHVVAATYGKGEVCLKMANVIYSKAKHLLDAPNKNGDTPLHCAARAGNVEMASCFIDLAGSEDSDGGDAARLKAVLRRQNKHGETALHEAVRFADEAMVGVLMSADVGLASVPGDGTSPLYLAVQLGNVGIAQLLYDKSGGQLSYSGPKGQSALHAAALLGGELTRRLLGWNKDLSKQRDQFGSTPLHFASSNSLCCTKLLVEADQSLAYQLGNNGSFPIHVASLVGHIEVVKFLLARCSGCAIFRDAQGRTFLHVAVEKGKLPIVSFACQQHWVASILNIQDKDRNTALHLAFQAGHLKIFRCLQRHQKICLSLANRNGQTPLDISRSKEPDGFNYIGNPEFTIHRVLLYAGALYGSYGWDCFQKQHIGRSDDKLESEKMTASTQVIAVGAVLITTVTFAAVFMLPGGYRADEHLNGGTPTLAGSYAFDAFLISNTLAFISSLLSIACLMYSGATMVNYWTRAWNFQLSIMLLYYSATSLGVAFATGLYVVLAPVAHKIAVVISVITSFAFLCGISAGSWQQLMEGLQLSVSSRVPGVVRRSKIRLLLVQMLFSFGPFIIIFGLPTCIRIRV